LKRASNGAFFECGGVAAGDLLFPFDLSRVRHVVEDIGHLQQLTPVNTVQMTQGTLDRVHVSTNSQAAFGVPSDEVMEGAAVSVRLHELAYCPDVRRLFPVPGNQTIHRVRRGRSKEVPANILDKLALQGGFR